MLKINPGMALGGGMGVGGEGAGTHNIVWSVFPLPCLPSFTSYRPSGPPKASEDSRPKGAPIMPERRRRVDTAPGLGHGRVRTQPCRRSSGLRSPHSTASAPSPQHGGCHALSPLALPPLPGAVGGDQRQPVHKDKAVPSSRPEGDSGGGGGGEPYIPSTVPSTSTPITPLSLTA